VPEFLARHNRYRPDAVVAYTNAIYEFARMLRERGIEPYSPRAIIVGAEKLHLFQRELIQEVFSTPVFETYGSREFMLIGAECERHEGLHLTHEQLLVEILDDQGNPTPDGQEGNVVITDLYNLGMPFVRYVTGDRGISGWASCSCGRGLPLMKPIKGRQLDVLTTPDGRRVPGEFFPHLMKDFKAVQRFQVLQDAPDRVRLRLVAGPAWSIADAARVSELASGALGPAVSFEIVRANEISLTGQGKLCVVVNNCRAAEINQRR
jgi:phenylacetate-CoA ligase